MHTRIPFALLAFAFAVVPARAQTIPKPPLGYTHLIVPVSAATFVPSPERPSRVRVPAREQVTLSVPDGTPDPTAWRKDGNVIPGAVGRTLTLASTTPTDSGFYTFDGLPWPHFAAGVRLQVLPEGNLANMSARLTLEGTQPQIVGFYVSGPAWKSLLFRVTGPSLAQFAITDFAPQPRIKAYDSQGVKMGWGRGGFPIDWERAFALVGAFPITGGEKEGEAYSAGPFPPGAYTLHIEDASGVGGTVLAEIYEVPDEGLPERQPPLTEPAQP